MNRGALIFAHNSRDVDYALLALLSGSLVANNLKVPVSLVTDKSTLSWCEESGILKKIFEVFDKVIEVEKPITDNKRNLHDGTNSKSVQFTNTNRSSVWNLTPYDRTLLLDSDFLIFSQRLSQYWDVNESVILSHSMNDIFDKKRVGYHDRYISDTGPHMYWATAVMFTKNKESEMFFSLVDHVRQNYQYYADLFRFDPRQFRNDIAFSIAKHILHGFETPQEITLPPLLTIQDKDVLYDVDSNGKLMFLVQTDFNLKYSLCSTTGLDVHVMNKQSIVRNKDKLLALI
jgi:alpha-N-acetylglucosamine transferase